MKLKIYILATGTELTSGKSLDTNSQWIANEFTGLGYFPRKISILPDKPEVIKKEIRSIMEEEEEKFIVMTGGLGATADDHTLDIISEIVGKGLKVHEKAYEKLIYISEQKGKVYQDLLPVSVRQTKVPEGSIVLENEVGLAPGFIVSLNDSTRIACFPGVPKEMKPMFQRHFLKIFKREYETNENTFFTKSIWGITEGVFQETFIKSHPDVFLQQDLEWGVSAKPGYIQVSFRSDNYELFEQAKNLLTEKYKNVMTDNVFTDVHKLLIDSKATVATAESCTGGLISKMFTDVPGSSAYYIGSIIAYHNRIKELYLGVPKQTLEEYGSVSEQTAIAMAEGIQERFDTNYAISVTGIAGPGGGTKEKKVGLVYIGIKSNKNPVEVHRYDLTHLNRETFREYVANTSFFLLYQRLFKDYYLE